jgi:hypothetical protein
LEDDGGDYRFTTNALEQGPASAGDATDANQVLILEDLVDIKGTAFAKDTNSLVDLALAGSQMTLENAAITAVKFDLSTAYPLTAADAGASQVARVGADGDTLEDLSDEIAGVAGDASAANQVLILEDLVDIKGTAFAKDTDSLINLAHIGADSDTLEVLSDEIAAVSALISTLDTVADNILTSTGADIDGKIDTLDTVADDIKKLLRADFEVDNAKTPYEYLLLEEGTANVLVTKEMYEVDDTNITALTQVVGKMLKP